MPTKPHTHGRWKWEYGAELARLVRASDGAPVLTGQSFASGLGALGFLGKEWEGPPWAIVPYAPDHPDAILIGNAWAIPELVVAYTAHSLAVSLMCNEKVTASQRDAVLAVVDQVNTLINPTLQAVLQSMGGTDLWAGIEYRQLLNRLIALAKEIHPSCASTLRPSSA